MCRTCSTRRSFAISTRSRRSWSRASAAPASTRNTVWSRPAAESHSCPASSARAPRERQGRRLGETMKLASLKGGRDGKLVVVSRDLAWCTDASFIAPTLQAALDDWGRVEAPLRLLATDLEHGVIPRER